MSVRILDKPISPPAAAHDRRHDDPQSIANDATILHPCGGGLQPAFRPVARRVLVVEDEALILMMLEAMLADLGCDSVTVAATINKALALIDAQAFDAALLDMNMNGNPSHQVAKALVARGVPFVYCTEQRHGVERTTTSTSTEAVAL